VYVDQVCDAFYRRRVRFGVSAGAFLADCRSEFVVDEAVCGGDLRRRVAGHALADAVGFDHGDRLPRLLTQRRRR
jgi:hypothetical protein